MADLLGVAVGHELWRALSFAFGMTWEVLWALILGFALSAVVQAVVSKREMRRLMPDDSPRTLAVATGLGAASSSCSYASVALARSLFRKGADFTAAMAFEIASTNRSEEHTSELQSRFDLVCRLLLEKKKKNNSTQILFELAINQQITLSCSLPTVLFLSSLLYASPYFFFFTLRPPPTSTLFPYTTLFRSGLGAASSSCSYASVALARSLFRKGADFTAAMAFEIASTN